MKKIIVLIFLSIVITGCSADYVISVKNNKIHEKMTIRETNKALFDTPNDAGWTMRESFKSITEENEFEKEQYKFKLIDKEDEIGVDYESNELEDFTNSSLLLHCYTNPTITAKGNIITVNTGDNFECYDYYENIDSIKVTLDTNHKVISNNADEVNGNKYTWYIKEDGNKKISFSYDKTITDFDYTPIIIGVIAIFIMIIAWYFISKKVQIKNKF